MPVITQRLVSSAKPRRKKYEIACTALRGFILRVLPTGKKVYYARFRRDGKDIRQRIGPVERVTLERARQRAGEYLSGAACTSQPTAPAPAQAATAAPGDGSPLLRDFVPRFMESHVNIAIKPATANTYRLTLKNHVLPWFGHKRLASITKEDVQRFVASRADRPQAARTGCMVLSVLFGRAIDWNVLPANFHKPTRGVRTKPPRMRERFLSLPERDRVNEVLETGLTKPGNARGYLHWSTVFAIKMLALTGMRSAEVYELRWEYVDFEHQVFRLPDSKTGQKSVPFSSTVLRMLCDELVPRKVGPWVFPSRWNPHRHVAKSSVGNAWRRVREVAGLGDVTIHDLRHSYASDALMSGVPIEILAKVLGHKSPRTTHRYAHVSNQAIASAVERTDNRVVRSKRTRQRKRRRKSKQG